MEEYGPIIWTVAFIGFMAYSAIAQRRKKAAQEAGEHTSEAWPSWDAPEETSETQENRDEKPQQEPFTYENTPQQEPFSYENAPQKEPFSYENTPQQEPFSYDNAPEWQAEEHFEDDTTSEYREEGVSSTPPNARQSSEGDSGAQREANTVNTQAFQAVSPLRATQVSRTTSTFTAPLKSAVTSKKETPDTGAHPEEEVQNGLGEEFDVRKAVLYSEILKPKFDE